jgi:hypothetical protein
MTGELVAIRPAKAPKSRTGPKFNEVQRHEAKVRVQDFQSGC